MTRFKQNILAVLSLFTSFSTLFCCALPVVLVILGLGAVVASTFHSIPFLLFLADHKGLTLLGASLLLGVNFFLVYRNKREAETCEIDPGTGKSACGIASKWNKRILWVSLSIIVIGFTVSYVAFPVLRFLGIL